MSIRRIVMRALGLWLNMLNILFPKKAGDTAFYFFDRPPKPFIRPKEVTFLATAERLDMHFEGKNIAIYGWGGDFTGAVPNETAKPYALLSYGWGYNAGRWRYFVPPLVEAGYRIIAFDPPGHGNSDAGLLEYPMMVRLQTAIIEQFGRPELLLGHSFGGSCFIGALAALPRPLHPARVCLMGIFSEARYVFHGYRRAIGMNLGTYHSFVKAISRLTGRRLSSFDNARIGSTMGHIECLFLHDPADEVTGFSNAIRNHAYWPGSALHHAVGAGHHLSTAETTRIIMNWLIQGALPATASISPGLTDADHELRRYFVSLEQDLVHGKVEIAYYA
ncbi:MAG: alpha/beta fold hydrolase [Bacteroidota bacterium]